MSQEHNTDLCPCTQTFLQILKVSTGKMWWDILSLWIRSWVKQKIPAELSSTSCKLMKTFKVLSLNWRTYISLTPCFYLSLTKLRYFSIVITHREMLCLRSCSGWMCNSVSLWFPRMFYHMRAPVKWRWGPTSGKAEDLWVSERSAVELILVLLIKLGVFFKILLWDFSEVIFVDLCLIFKPDLEQGAPAELWLNVQMISNH